MYMGSLPLHRPTRPSPCPQLSIRCCTFYSARCSALMKQAVYTLRKIVFPETVAYAGSAQMVSFLVTATLGEHGREGAGLEKAGMPSFPQQV